MSATNDKQGARVRELWEAEILARHRWGQHGDKAQEELARLQTLWEAARPIESPCLAIAEQIIALEICNWHLEGSVLTLCRAIGDKLPADVGIGHLASVSEARWRKVWAYYLTLRDWLPTEGRSGYASLLGVCDPEGRIREHVLSLLGDRNELKELYVGRFCLCLEFWLGGYWSGESLRMKAHKAAVAVLEGAIRERDPEARILDALQLEGDGKLQPCHHKAFRRYDIVLSSIGAGQWRAVMPMRGTDGYARAATLEKLLAPITAWIEGRAPEDEGDELYERIQASLGEPGAGKLFLTSLLISLLHAQQLAAVKRARSREAPPAKPWWRNCLAPGQAPDEEILALDAREDSLTPPNKDTEHIRGLITSFESCHHKAERQAQLIVEAIGTGHTGKGPGRRPPGQVHPVERIWRNSCDVLSAWCAGSPDELLGRGVGGLSGDDLIGHLGERTPIKVWQVQRVVDKIARYLDPTTMWQSGGVIDATRPDADPEPDAEFRQRTRETIIHDTLDGQPAEIGLADAIDHLEPCHWNFVGNLAIVLRAIGGDLCPETPLAFCGRNIVLTPIRERMRVVANSLRAFCEGREAGAEVDEGILHTLGDKTPVKRWLAASLEKTLRLQLGL